MDALLDRVWRFCAEHDLLPGGSRVLVGVSGGADSLVLLHLLLRLSAAHELTVAAATLDHGIRGAASAADVAFVQETCAEWGIPVITGEADVPQIARDHGWGLEDAARRVRYAFLKRAADAVQAERIAVGHHRDDQAETVLLHMIRGSGLAGLRGMLPATPLSEPPDDDFPIVIVGDRIDLPETRAQFPTALIRPLLVVSRAEIEHYATHHDLHPRNDATNWDTAYRRNRLRHEVIPLLETLNPAVAAAAARLADSLRDDYDRLHDLWAESYARVLIAERQGAVVLDRAIWHDLHASDQRAIVRQIVKQLQAVPRDVTSAHVAASLQLAARGKPGGELALPGNVLLRVAREEITFLGVGAPVDLLDAPMLDSAPDLSFTAGETVERWFGSWLFSARPLADPATIDAITAIDAIHADPLAAVLAVPAGTRLVLRQRQPGDVFCPRGMEGHSQKLKDTLIAMRVPVHWRDYVPLLVAGEAIAWFVGPSAAGLRGRVSEHVAVPAAGAAAHYRLMVVRWSRVP